MEFYRQTTEYTCAACSLLMVLNHFKPDYKLNRENEFKIWRETANLPTRAPSIYGLSVLAKKEGLNVSLVLEEMEYDYPDYRFKGYTKKEIDEAKFMSKTHAREAREANIKIEHRDVNIDEIKKLLTDGKILMLRVNAGIFRDTRSTSKYLVFYKISSDEHFTVLDPFKGTLTIDEKDLEQALETLHTKKKRDRRMIVFS